MLLFHVTPQITSPVIRFGYQSECASHHPNALAIRMRKPSKHLGRVPPSFHSWLYIVIDVRYDLVCLKSLTSEPHACSSSRRWDCWERESVSWRRGFWVAIVLNLYLLNFMWPPATYWKQFQDRDMPAVLWIDVRHVMPTIRKFKNIYFLWRYIIWLCIVLS